MNTNERGRVRLVVAGEMLDEPFADFPGEVESGEARVFLFQEIDDAQALAVVLEPAMVFHERVEGGLAFVAEGRMAEVVRERNGFGKVFVQAQSARNVAGNAGHFDAVGEASAEVIAG